MKRLVLLSVLVITAGAVMLELIRTDTGYVLISMGSKTVEMSFWVAVTLLLTSALVLWLLVFLLKRLIRLLTGGLGLASKRDRKVEERTTAGLIHFIEGNWRAARKDLLKAAKHARSPLVHYLTAARCSYELGERDETHQLLHQAEKIAPRNELAVALSQARIQLLDEKYEQCLATLKRARLIAPHHPTILDLLRQVYWQLRDWPSLQALLPELRKQKLYQEDEQAFLEQNVYMASLSAAGTRAKKLQSRLTSGRGGPPGIKGESTKGESTRGESTKGNSTKAETSAEQILSQAWQSLPKKMRAEDSVIDLYGKLLIDLGLSNQAERLLQQRLSQHWKSDVVATYGRIASSDPKEQLIVAEQWLREHPGDADLLLALGRISVRNQLWGKAREYFESSLKLRPRSETYAELARLLAYMGEHEKSTELYQQGLLATTHGLPAFLPMPEEEKRLESGKR